MGTDGTCGTISIGCLPDGTRLRCQHTFGHEGPHSWVAPLEKYGLHLFGGVTHEDAVRQAAKGNLAARVILDAEWKRTHPGVYDEGMSSNAPVTTTPEVIPSPPGGTNNPPAPAVSPTPAEITYDDFLKVDLRVGEVLSAEAVPKSEKLLKLQVNFGDLGVRQVIAGIGLTWGPDFLVGSRFVFVTNLKPRKIMGLESHGMILAAGEPDKLNILKTFCPVGVSFG